jgi:hypothetical protein
MSDLCIASFALGFSIATLIAVVLYTERAR